MQSILQPYLALDLITQEKGGYVHKTTMNKAITKTRNEGVEVTKSENFSPFFVSMMTIHSYLDANAQSYQQIEVITKGSFT